jgi:hypothetical protein
MEAKFQESFSSLFDEMAQVMMKSMRRVYPLSGKMQWDKLDAMVSFAAVNRTGK